MMPLTSTITTATMAPRLEIYTMLACSVHKPDIFKQNYPGLELGLQASSPVFPPSVFNTSTIPTPLFDLHASPVYFPGISPFLGSILMDESESEDLPPSRRNQCASDKVVQAAVAKLSGSE